MLGAMGGHSPAGVVAGVVVQPRPCNSRALQFTSAFVNVLLIFGPGLDRLGSVRIQDHFTAVAEFRRAMHFHELMSLYVQTNSLRIHAAF